jgi:preprotein translocase subunit SecA
VLDAEGKEIKKLSKTSCDTCGNEYVPYSLSEVPEEKILEQRERYRQMKKTEFIKMLSAYQDMSRSNILADMMREVSDRPVGYTVKEDDAGQEAIDTAERADREAKRREEIEFKESYRGAQRNDKCRCGSGNKYKKCCLPKVDSIR